MLISFSKEFVFIKTRKTAGSSLHFAFCNELSKGDYVSPMFPAHRNMGLVDCNQVNIGGHGALSRALETFPEISGDNWTYITVERNPWAKAVSLFYWETKGKINKDERTIDYDIKWFQKWALKKRANGLGSDWKRYTINDSVAVDFIIQHSNIYEDYTRACQLVGINPVVELPKIASKIKPYRYGYRRYYNKKVRKHVADLFAKEIDYFGYQF